MKKKEESMKRLRKIGSIFFALMITVCLFGAFAIQQFEIVVSENDTEESLYEGGYDT